MRDLRFPTSFRVPFALTVLLVLAVPLGLAPPAAADWLRTREGALVETSGAWKVKGRVVIFTAKNGTLSSLRLSEVDLDASAEATFNAKEARPEEPKKEDEQEPVLVLTNKDVPRAWSDEVTAEPEDTTEAGAPAAPLVAVTSWRQAEKPEYDGIELHGTVQNQAPDLITDLRVLVRLIGEEGEVLGSSNAFLGALSLAPSSTTRFRVLFPELTATSFEPRFDVRSNSIQLEGVVTPQQSAGNES